MIAGSNAVLLSLGWQAEILALAGLGEAFMKLGGGCSNHIPMMLSIPQEFRAANIRL